MTRRVPRLVAVLVAHIALQNEPLAGDLAEAWCAGRSRAWICLEMAVALATIARSFLRAGARFTIDSLAADLVAVGVLSACVAITANVAARALESLGLMPAVLTAYRGWGIASPIVSLAVAFMCGAGIHRIAECHRRAAIVLLGAVTFVAAFINAHLVPTASPGAFFPSSVLQILVTSVFILGLSSGLSATAPRRARS